MTFFGRPRSVGRPVRQIIRNAHTRKKRGSTCALSASRDRHNRAQIFFVMATYGRISDMATAVGSVQRPTIAEREETYASCIASTLADGTLMSLTVRVQTVVSRQWSAMRALRAASSPSRKARSGMSSISSTAFSV